MGGQRYWIWSNEHGAWWPLSRFGYVRSLSDAGTFTAEEAGAIVRDANIAQEGRSWITRNEVSIPAIEEPVDHDDLAPFDDE